MRSYRTFPPLPNCFGGISLLHLPWSRLHQPLTGIPALWCSDFPHSFPEDPKRPAVIQPPYPWVIVQQIFRFVKQKLKRSLRPRKSEKRCAGIFPRQHFRENDRPVPLLAQAVPPDMAVAAAGAEHRVHHQVPVPLDTVHQDDVALPVLLGAGLGLPMLRRRATAGWLRNTVALAIIAVGFVSAGMSPSTLAVWCRT